MPRITSVTGRVLYNSRGSKTIEVDVATEKTAIGRACAPSGASVGKHEVPSFSQDNPESSLNLLKQNSEKFIGIDSSDLKSIHDTVRSIDDSPKYEKLGGAVAYAVTIASIDSSAKYSERPFFSMISESTDNLRFPFPLGNILGGGSHAGPGTPDIQEVLVCPIGSKNIMEAIDTNIAVHRELRKVIEENDPEFTNGRGDEGAWAPKAKNEQALEMSAKAIERLGLTLGKEVALGVDFASSTLWDDKTQKYHYKREGFEKDSSEQIDYVSNLVQKYKLVYAEDPVHEEAFEETGKITAKFPDVLVTGDDLLVTNTEILRKASKSKSCNAAILKVNQAGSLYDALEFAKEANNNNIKLITSHRSGESTDSHISHIGIATGSKMLKVGVVGGERVSKLNELIRISEHDLIRGMAEI